MKRFSVAVIFFPFFYFLVAFHYSLLFFLFVLLISCLGLYEFYGLFFKEKKLSVLFIGEILSIFLITAFYIQGVKYLDFSFILPFCLTFIFLFFFGVCLLINKESVFLSICVMGMGLIYVTWFLGHLVLIRTLDHGVQFIFLLAMITWGTDAGAFFIGRSIGKKKLAPLISPHKTLEGAIGGLLSGILMGGISKIWFLPFISSGEVLGVAFFLGILGQIGDLVESMFKRSNDVKDSGHLLPGHGGILDKIDSFIFTGPALYYYLVLFRQV